MKRLTEKVALVTGAGSGIGRAIALRLAAEGAAVGVLDHDEESGEATAGAIREGGGSAAFVACDVATESSVDEAVGRVESGLGPLELAVNNAGVASVGSVIETDAKEFDRVMAVNARGVFLCLKAEVARMLGHGRGAAIVNVGSIVAGTAVPQRFAYSAAKGAVHAMTRSVACDFVKEKIRCNTVAPGRVHTPFVDGFLARHYPGHERDMFDKLSATQPVGRMAQPGEIAALVAYLCSDEATFITGTVVEIDGGFANLKP